RHVAAAFIPAHELELRPDGLIEQQREGDVLVPGAGVAENELSPHRVFDGPNTARTPGNDEVGVLVETADPVHLARIETDVAVRQQRLEQIVPLQQSDDAAVRGSRALQLAGREQAGSAGGVLNDQRGMPRYVLSQMTRNDPRIEIGAAAG